MLLVPPPDRRHYMRRPSRGHRMLITANRITGSLHSLSGRRWRWIVLAVMAYALLGGKLGLVRLIGLYHDTTRLNSDIKQLEVQCSTLDSDLKRFTSDSTAIERVAREELDWGRKGEVVFKFPQQK